MAIDRFEQGGPPQGGGVRKGRTTAPGTNRPGYGAPPPPPPNPLIQQYNSFIAGQQGQLQGNYLNQLGQAGAVRDLNLDFLNRGQGNDLARLNEQRYRSIDLERQALQGNEQDLAARRGLLGERYGLAQEGYDLDMKSIGQQYASNLKGYQSDLGYMQGLYDDYSEDRAFNEQEAALRSRGNTLSRDRGTRLARSDATARGAATSRGLQDEFGDITSQFQLAQDSSQTQLQRAQTGVGREEDLTTKQIQDRYREYQDVHEGLGIQGEGAFLQLKGQRNALGGQGLDLDQRGGDLYRTGQALDSLAREYGVKESDIRNAFEQASAKMNLDYNSTQQQLGQMLNSGNAALQAQAYNFLSQIMAFA